MGPLAGIKVVEAAGIGPGPFCGMMLADMGAEVIAVGRGHRPINTKDPSTRGRVHVNMDLKSKEGLEAFFALTDKADVFFEGFRPGVCERLGFGPEVLLKRNPRLVYGRMTGWGQDGPLAQAAGHDINYISITGALSGIGRKGERPVPPLNLVGDFGGGGMFLAFGIAAALVSAQKTGKGQVVDAAMTEGAIALMAMFIGMNNTGTCLTDQPGDNFLGGRAHFYDSYETKDGKYVSIASLEPQFYELLIQKLGLERAAWWPWRSQGEHGLAYADWDRLKAELAKIFRTRTRDEWCALMEGTDVCFAPVLTLSEAPNHPHNRARQSFITVDGATHNAPAPRFSGTPTATPRVAMTDPASVERLLAAWQFDPAAAARIKAQCKFG